MAMQTSWIRTAAIWSLRIAIAGLFVVAAVMKLSGQPMMVKEFAMIGFGQWFRYFTGLVEMLGAIALFVRPVANFGVLILLAVDVGAFIAQIAVLHKDWIHTVVIASLLAVLFFMRLRSQKRFKQY